jgi:DNA-directed RNA polymerase specialized sigma24 family protein
MWAPDRRSAALCVLGLTMLGSGFLYDGANKDVVASALILLGAAELAIGVLLPRLQELEIGPGGFRTKLTAEDTAFRPVVTAEAPRLERFAKLMCGDSGLARELVEEALAMTREQQRRVPKSERSRLALRTLIELVETAAERRWMRGLGTNSEAPDTSDSDRAVIEALRRVEFEARAAFVLRVDWALGVEDIAGLLDRTADAVREDIERARAELRPYVEVQP